MPYIEGWTDAYWDSAAEDFTDPPRPKPQALKRRNVKLHRLKDGGALCNSGKPWFAYPDEQPTCEKCLSQMTQLEREATV